MCKSHEKYFSKKVAQFKTFTLFCIVNSFLPMKLRTKNYTIDSVVKSLSKKHDVFIDLWNYSIQVLKGDRAINDLGNGSWGKIDFLKNNFGFQVFTVTKFE